MFTIDASVHISALNVAEQNSSHSQAFIEWVYHQKRVTYSPTLLLVEVAAAVSRILDNVEQGLAMAQAVRELPGQVWVALDDTVAWQAARLAAEQRLRGADAIYAAVARRYEAILVTWDQQQLERLHPALRVMTPIEALAHLANLAENEESKSEND
jgi:predicted nucleic acid-binding protein